jgi:hypothetical protein
MTVLTPALALLVSFLLMRVPQLAPAQSAPPGPLLPPTLLGKEQLEQGNPLAQWVAMVELEAQYRASKMAGFYAEARANAEEFLGFPLAGVAAMSLPALRGGGIERSAAAIPAGFAPQRALDVIARAAGSTRAIIWAEEHHLPQTRSLLEPMLKLLRDRGYRYFAAEAFTDEVASPGFAHPDYRSGYYVRDPVFAAAIRVARELGYRLVAYESTGRGPANEPGFRDRTQAENLMARIFDRDHDAKALIVAGRLHASEIAAPDGWTPMACVLKQVAAIDPFTVYAPTMSQRLTPEEESPLYRAATAGTLDAPTIFVETASGRTLGFSSCDAYVFWPRFAVVEGRPDWMVRTLGRRRVAIPGAFVGGDGPRLVQAFFAGEPVTAIPADQVVLTDEDAAKVLMLAPGAYSLRTIDPAGDLLAQGELRVAE